MPYPIPSPSLMDDDCFRHALELYPAVVERAYRVKLKGDATKLKEAMERDHWRFEELPTKFYGHGEAVLTKEELERLVQWKITHGHSRPFLPAMIRKNAASIVETLASDAHKELKSDCSAEPPSLATVKKALTHTTQLTGVGPATGTLILSIFSPNHIPFFQDEMYAWFFPQSGSTKLKYTVKEYEELFTEATGFMHTHEVKAVELEKVTFVLGHFDVLTQDEKTQLEIAQGIGTGEHDPVGRLPQLEETNKNLSLTMRDGLVKGEGKKSGDADAGEDGDDDGKGEARAKAGAKPAKLKAATKRSRKEQDEGSKEAQAPKRRSQRNR